MKNKIMFIVIGLAFLVSLLGVNADNYIFKDDFTDSSINTSFWSTNGVVTEGAGLITLTGNTEPNNGVLWIKAGINVSQRNLLFIIQGYSVYSGPGDYNTWNRGQGNANYESWVDFANGGEFRDSGGTGYSVQKITSGVNHTTKMYWNQTTFCGQVFNTTDSYAVNCTAKSTDYNISMGFVTEDVGAQTVLYYFEVCEDTDMDYNCTYTSAPNTTQVFLNSSSLTNLTNENLTCYANITDADGGNVYANFTWYNNTVSYLSGQSSAFTQNTISLVSTLTSGNTTKNENWTCSINAYDGTNYETDWNNATITILNALPNTTSVLINSTLLTNKTTENITCYANITDNDLDSVYANFTWYKNTVLNFSGQSSVFTQNTNGLVSTLLSGNLTATNNWTCSVRAYDGTDYETDWNNKTITILSANSLPNTTIVLINSTSLTNRTNENLTCYATINDTDLNDNLDGNFSWFKNGVLNISGQQTNIQNNNISLISIIDLINTTKGDNWTCSVQAYDGTDYESDWNNKTLTVLNSLPTLTLISPSNNFILSQNYVNLIVSYEDADDNTTQNITLYADILTSPTSLKQTWNLAKNNTQYSYEFQLSEGEKDYYWYASINDDGTLINSSVRKITLDIVNEESSGGGGAGGAVFVPEVLSLQNFKYVNEINVWAEPGEVVSETVEILNDGNESEEITFDCTGNVCAMLQFEDNHIINMSETLKLNLTFFTKKDLEKEQYNGLLTFGDNESIIVNLFIPNTILTKAKLYLESSFEIPALTKDGQPFKLYYWFIYLVGTLVAMILFYYMFKLIFKTTAGGLVLSVFVSIAISALLIFKEVI